jgi:threonine/homoserine/homoserine lactone efflux protein
VIEIVTPFVAYVLAPGIAAAIPGPGVAAMIGRALGTEAGTSVPFILSLAFGDVLFLSVAGLGSSAFAAAASGVFSVVKIADGLYLLYLAWRFWTVEVERTDAVRVAPQGSTADEAKQAAKTDVHWLDDQLD